MARTSAGLLLHRRAPDGGVEVLLGHMGGPFWAGKEVGAWTIPKGEHGPDEDPLGAALREFAEEVGKPPPPGPDVPLGTVRQSGGKSVTVWARAGDLDPAGAISTSTVTMEWPPRSGRRITFPELDRVQWWPLEEGARVVVRAQAELLHRLAAVVAAGEPAPAEDA